MYSTKQQLIMSSSSRLSITTTKLEYTAKVSNVRSIWQEKNDETIQEIKEGALKRKSKLRKVRKLNNKLGTLHEKSHTFGGSSSIPISSLFDNNSDNKDKHIYHANSASETEIAGNLALESFSFKDRVKSYQKSVQLLFDKDRNRIESIKKARRAASTDRIRDKKQQKRAQHLLAQFVTKHKQTVAKNDLITDLLSFEVKNNQFTDETDENTVVSNEMKTNDTIGTKPIEVFEELPNEVKIIESLSAEDCILKLKSLNVFHEIFVPINAFERWSKRAQIDNVFENAMWEFISKMDKKQRMEANKPIKTIKGRKGIKKKKVDENEITKSNTIKKLKLVSFKKVKFHDTDESEANTPNTPNAANLDEFNNEEAK